jgi:hypothetical protein
MSVHWLSCVITDLSYTCKNIFRGGAKILDWEGEGETEYVRHLLHGKKY